jgi:arylsulfatase A
MMTDSTRRTFLKSLGLGAMATSCGGSSTATGNRPNILVLLADDMGYTDINCYGGDIRTPNVNQLAAEGIQFTSCYSSAPNCSPARTGLMTGRIPSRTGIYSYIPENHPMHLPRTEITVAKLLQQAGYATCHVGKWHLNGLFNSPEQPQPNDHGFDYWFSTQNNAEPSHLNPVNFVRNGEAVGPLEGYSCQIVADEAISWLENRGGGNESFFQYVCFHEPHKKLASPPELMDTYGELSDADALYYANITNLDLAVGKMLSALDRLDIADNTMVFFLSDNGPWRDGSQGVLRGKKSEVYDGGIKVPGIMRWPGHTTPGGTSDVPVSFLDFLPTVCAATGVPEPDDRTLDGVSLLPLLAGQPLDRSKPLFWYFYRTQPAAAMRKGDWSIVARLDMPKSGSHGMVAQDMPIVKKGKLVDFELYNLKTDVSQQKNLAASEQATLQSLKEEIVRLHADVVAEGPVWDTMPVYNKK